MDQVFDTTALSSFLINSQICSFLSSIQFSYQITRVKHKQDKYGYDQTAQTTMAKHVCLFLVSNFGSARANSSEFKFAGRLRLQTFQLCTSDEPTARTIMLDTAFLL